MSKIIPYRIYDDKTAQVVLTGSWAKVCRFLESHGYAGRYHVWVSVLVGA